VKSFVRCSVLLSFDIEEFDMPLEYGKSLPLDEQIEISSRGTGIILDMLRKYEVHATFFSTAVFATHATSVVHRLVNDGHELASHGYFHSKFEDGHLLESKVTLERISGQRVNGFRMPRMMPVNDEAIQRSGYTYNSSMNPIFLPGRYNNFFKPRTIFHINDTVQLPASVTPSLRFPLFWLSFHNVPLAVYKAACARTMERDKYLNIYFHPWEFTDLRDKKFGLPWYVSKNSGSQMIKRFEELLKWMKEKKYHFSTINEYLRML